MEPRLESTPLSRAPDVPLVSVLLPVRDAAAHLPDCLRSIQRQSLQTFELLVIDDGSTDATAEQVRSAARIDPRIRHLCLIGRRGLVAALQHGLNHARAELVARMDGDDLMHPRRLELQVACLQADPGLGLVASRVRAFPRDHIGVGMRAYLDWQDGCRTAEQMALGIYVEAPFVHPTVMFRKSVVAAAGGYRGGDFPEDYELWLRLQSLGVRMHKLNRALLHWRQHPHSASRTDPRYRREAFDRLRVDYLRRDPRIGSRPLVFWGAGRRTRRRAALLMQAGHAPVAWIDVDPRKIGNRIAGVPVHPPHWLDSETSRRLRPLVLNFVASHGAREL
ncbi:MAG: glycosyltransferase, partial [Gammaproteobacteria bacterium]|nr:glycosyltransferase [Gammaproteobacteria bacterium]